MGERLSGAGGATDAEPTSRGLGVELLEREAVTDAVAGLLDRARDGRGGALFIVGQAGLGKTTCLARARHVARGFQIGSGRGDPYDRDRPYAPVIEAIDQLGLGGLILSGEHGRPAEGNLAAWPHLVLRRLEQGAGAPVLLAFDDLHWSGADTLSLLSFLCRRLGGMRIAVIGTLRSYPPAVHDVCSSLAEAGCATLHTLAPLSEGGAAELLARRAGRPPAEGVARRAWRLSVGNPLLLEQLALAIVRSEFGPDESSDRLAGVVNRLLLSRFANIPDEARRYAQAASVFGPTFRPEVVAEVTRMENHELDIALGVLDRTGLVREAGQGLVELVHPLFRTVLYDDLGPLQRTRLHTLAFRALARAGADVEAADHAARADLVGDEEAIAVLARVGRRAALAGAPLAAITRLRAAIRLSADRVRPELVASLAAALLAADLPAEAVRLCGEVDAHPDATPLQRADARRTAARAWLLAGMPVEALAGFASSATHEQPRGASWTADERGDHVLAALLAAGPAEAAAVLDLAPPPVSSSEPVATLRVAVDSLRGAPSAHQGEGAHPPEPPVETAWCRHLVARLAERHQESDGVFEVRAETAAGPGRGGALLLVDRIHGLADRGRLVEALALSEGAVKDAERVPLVTAAAWAARGRVLLALGRFPEGEEVAVRAEAAATAGGQRLWMLAALSVRGGFMLAAGDHLAADRFFRRCLELSLELGLREPCLVPWARQAVMAALGADRPDRALEVVRWLEECSESLVCRWPRIAAHDGRASIAEREGDDASAEAHHRAALALHEGLDRPLERCLTLLGYGAFLRRAGRPVAARAHLGEALRLAEAAGAIPLAARVVAELAVAGGRRRRRDEPDALTAQERRVAQLAAEGLSNKEIGGRLYLSVKTVETHLQHIFSKLEIRSRRQLILMNAAELQPAGAVR